MEKIEKLSWWVVLIAALVLGLMCHVAFGWKFAPVVVAIALVWVSAKTTKWLLFVAIALVGWIMFTSYFPQLASKGTFGILATDIYAASKIDSVQIKANDMLEAEKNRQKQAILNGRYKQLLKAGRANEAQAVLDSIEQAFTIERPEQDAPEHRRPNNSITTLPVGTTTIEMLVNPGDESGWYKFPESCSKGEYSFKSSDYGFEVYFSDGGTPFPGRSTIPHKTDPVFKFKAVKPNQAITITLILTQ